MCRIDPFPSTSGRGRLVTNRLEEIQDEAPGVHRGTRERGGLAARGSRLSGQYSAESRALRRKPQGWREQELCRLGRLAAEVVPRGPGQPDIAVQADIEIPAQNISIRWLLRRNDDRQLPASHRIEIVFTLPSDFPHGGISNVPGMLMKPGETTRGVPLSGITVKS